MLMQHEPRKGEEGFRRLGKSKGVKKNINRRGIQNITSLSLPYDSIDLKHNTKEQESILNAKYILAPNYVLYIQKKYQ